jgi:hypothetical protein
MKASELRIGNYISRCDLFDNHVRIEQILGIDKKATTTGAFKVLCTYSEIEPIPLTEEWLLNFGFKHIKGDFNRGRIKIDCYSMQLPHTYGATCYLESFKKEGNLSIKMNWLNTGFHMEYDYVHQLQNLYFALTNDELKIK